MAGLATFTVILLDPKTRASSADLFWVPEHDTRRGANVMTTLTSPHGFSPARLTELRKMVPPQIAALPCPRVAILIGGPNGDYRYTASDEARLIAGLKQLPKSGAGLDADAVAAHAAFAPGSNRSGNGGSATPNSGTALGKIPIRNFSRMRTHLWLQPTASTWRAKRRRRGSRSTFFTPRAAARNSHAFMQASQPLE